MNLHVAPIRPSKPLKLLQERGDLSLCFRVALFVRNQHANPLHRGLLRTRAERPRRRRAADQRDELAASHSITSSARPSSGSGTVSPRALAGLGLMIRRWEEA